MAEYNKAAVQTVENGNNILFENGCNCCRKNTIQHRDNSGLFILRGTCQHNATYRVMFTGNTAIATGETVEPISIALTINGETVGNGEAIVTPAAASEYFNVNISALINVPCGCCLTISVKNTSNDAAVNIQNANIIIDRIS